MHKARKPSKEMIEAEKQLMDDGFALDEEEKAEMPDAEQVAAAAEKKMKKMKKQKMKKQVSLVMS